MIQPTGRINLSHRRPTNLPHFLYGAAYYPEHWDAETRRDDAERMQAARFNVVRMAEFAWDLMEPKEGVFDFSVFEESIHHLGAHGIQTILCTPTATPPRWLTHRFPDILRVDADGRRLHHGSRQHACHSSKRFRDYSKTITEAMAEHFADNPHVIGWQTDNEFHCGFSECHCDNCQQAFRSYLKEVYTTIEAVNNAWGTRFWALTYSSFDEIETPKQNRPSAQNPAMRLDYLNFLSWAVTHFQHDQVRLLRQANASWLIMHNGVFSNIDYRGPFTQDLDLLGYDLYPGFCFNSQERRYWQAYSLDRVRSMSGNFIIPEHQSGPGGQTGYLHDNPGPGEIRRMTYTSISRGADSILYFRWRTCRFGAEEYWCGILDHDNIPRRRYDEIAQIGQEIERIGPELMNTSVRVDVAVSAFDFKNDASADHLSFGLTSPKLIAEGMHRWFYSRGYLTGCVHPSDDLSRLRLYIIPHYTIIEEAWVDNLTAFVESGGTLVIGARSGTKSVQDNVLADTPPGPLAALTGVQVGEYGRQNDTDNLPLHLGNRSGEIQSSEWYEALELQDATPLALWQSRHLKGQPAISIRQLGKGQVIYVGTWMTVDLADWLLPQLLESTDLKPAFNDLPAGIEVSIRESATTTLTFLINQTNTALSLTNLPKGTNLITGQIIESTTTLKPHDVMIIKKDK